jgi:hypothetical protein
MDSLVFHFDVTSNTYTKYNYGTEGVIGEIAGAAIGFDSAAAAANGANCVVNLNYGALSANVLGFEGPFFANTVMNTVAQVPHPVAGGVSVYVATGNGKTAKGQFIVFVRKHNLRG